MVMKLTRNKLFDNLEDAIMALLIIYTSLYSMIVLSEIAFLDEFLILVLLFVSLFRSKTLELGITGKLILTYIGYAAIISVLNFANVIGFMEAIPFTIKVPLVFFIFSQLKISDERRNRLFLIFFLANIPSMLMGVWQYRHSGLGWALGLKMRNGIIRVTGYAGHPIWFSFSMIVMIIITVSVLNIFPKHKILDRLFRTILVAGMLFLINASQTRYAIAVLLILTYCWVLIKFYRNNKLFTFLTIFLGIVIVVFYGWSIFQEIIYGTDSGAVRAQGFMALPRAIYNYPFGSGLGTFGNKESVLYHSKVYSELGMSIPTLNHNFNSGNVYESMLIQRVVETGILGTICYVMTFIHPIKSYKFCSDMASVLILLTFFLNSIMNVAYQLPLIIVTGIAFSNILFNNKKTI